MAQDHLALIEEMRARHPSVEFLRARFERGRVQQAAF
jgi:hypothetical protein